MIDEHQETCGIRERVGRAQEWEQTARAEEKTKFGSSKASSEKGRAWGRAWRRRSGNLGLGNGGRRGRMGLVRWPSTNRSVPILFDSAGACDQMTSPGRHGFVGRLQSHALTCLLRRLLSPSARPPAPSAHARSSFAHDSGSHRTPPDSGSHWGPVSLTALDSGSHRV